MKHTKEYQEFVKKHGEMADILLAYTFRQQKGKLNETKRAKILGTLRTGKNDSRGVGIGIETGKTVSTDKLPTGQTSQGS